MKGWILSTLHCVVVSFVLYAIAGALAYILQGALVGRPEMLKATSSGGAVWLCTFEDELSDTHEKIMETREALSANERLNSPKMFFVPLAQAATMARNLAIEFNFPNTCPSPLCIRAAVLLTILRDMAPSDVLVLLRSRLTIKKDLNLLVTENLSNGSIALFKNPATDKFQTDFIIATRSDLTLRIARDFFSALVHANVTAATSTQADSIFNLIVSDLAAFSHLQVKQTIGASGGGDDEESGALAQVQVAESIQSNHDLVERTRQSVVALPSKASQFVTDARDKNGLSFVWVSLKEWAKAKLFGNVCAI